MTQNPFSKKGLPALLESYISTNNPTKISQNTHNTHELQ
jgi:hypothetical protein